MPQMCAPIPSELKKYDVSHLRLMMNAVLSLHNGNLHACESIRITIRVCCSTQESQSENAGTEDKHN
jgi:hypothetical protein